MNRFDEKYEIRFARYDEIDEVMGFIDSHWRAGHILARDRVFFEYEHVIDGQVNFLIAKDRETARIHGILGFLPASQNKDKYDIWGVVWKVVKDQAMPMLGVELQKRLIEYTACRAKIGVGANPNTAVPVLQTILKFQMAKMKHYYCLAEVTDYKIATVNHFEMFQGDNDYSVQVRELKSIEEVQANYNFKYNENDIPFKDEWYINKRYYCHPIYTYSVYGLIDKDDIMKALIVCRDQEYNGGKALRIVDYIGEPKLFGGVSGFLKDRLKVYEYIDFYFYGFDEKYVKQAGMTEVCDNDTNIIPNYFSPFVSENIDIWVESSMDGCRFFRADGDQDRPC